MEETEFREALRSVVAQSSEPPPMQSATVIAAGRKAVGRRRTLLACAGAFAALAAVTIVPVRYLSGDAGPEGGIPVAGPAAVPSAITTQGPSATPGPSTTPDPSATPSEENTEPSWPAEASGDATADTGPRYQRGKQLLADLLKVVPGGYATPHGQADDGSDLQWHQAAIENPEWSYLATAALAKDGGLGQILVEVHESANTLPDDPCQLATAFWGMGGDCRVQQVGAAKVGVATPAAGGDSRLGQWAAYRWSDDVVVFVGQARYISTDRSGTPLQQLAQLPFDTQTLAGLAVDERFHIGG